LYSWGVLGVCAVVYLPPSKLLLDLDIMPIGCATVAMAPAVVAAVSNISRIFIFLVYKCVQIRQVQ